MSSRLCSWLTRSMTSYPAAALITASSGPATVTRTRSPSASARWTPSSESNAIAGTGPAKWISRRRSFLRAQVPDVLDGDQATPSDDGDPVAHALDLGHHVGGEEHGPAFPARLADQLVELLLHQRIQPLGRLVQHEQLRPVHERLEQPDLLPVPVGERADAHSQVEVEALGERPEVGLVHTVTEGCQMFQVLPRQQVLVEGELAR